MIRSRNGLALFAVILGATGCAGPPAQPPVTGRVSGENIAEAQKAGYRVINQNGQPLYCRKDPVTGSRLQMRTQCLTQQQLDEQARQSVEQAVFRNGAP